MNHPLLRRAAAGLALPALVLGGLAAAPAAPAAAAPEAGVDPAPAQAGADWLAGQLEGGLFPGSSSEGVSIDAALAVAAVGGHEGLLGDVADAVGARIEAGQYVAGPDWGDADATYAGPVAKAVVLAQVAPRDPADFGGQDLFERLVGRVSTAPADGGRISDVSAYGDNANTIGQSFAARAFDAAGSDHRTEAVTDYLLLQQCDEGFFRLELGATSEDDCDADPEAEASIDVTAQVVLNLLGQDDDPEVAAAVSDAANWLVENQFPNGSFGSDADIPTPNANSTGLAGWALGEAGRDDAARDAAVWLRSVQVDDFGPCTTAVSAQRGAVAYDRAALRTARKRGLDTAADQFRRATAQAVPALRWAPAGGYAVEPVSDDRYVRAGTKVTLHADDVAPGQTVCFAAGASQALASAGADGTAAGRVALPAGTRNRQYRVAVRGQVLGTVTVRALGKTRLKLERAATVKRGAKQALKVSGLAPGEAVRVLFKGKKVKVGTASAKGRFNARFAVGRQTGKQTVKVVGQFGNRRGTAAFTVVRR